MAYITITTTPKTLVVNFNVYTRPEFGSKQVFKKEDLRHVKQDENLLFVYFDHQTSAFQVTVHGGSPYGLIVDSIDGVVPTSLSHLLTIIEGIMEA